MKPEDFDKHMRDAEKYFFDVLHRVAPRSRMQEIELAYRSLIAESPKQFPGATPSERRQHLTLIRGGRYGRPKRLTVSRSWNYRTGNDAA